MSRLYVVYFIEVSLPAVFVSGGALRDETKTKIAARETIEIDGAFALCLVCIMTSFNTQFNNFVFVSGFAYCYNGSRSHWPFCHLLDSIFRHELRVLGLYSHKF